MGRAPERQAHLHHGASGRATSRASTRDRVFWSRCASRTTATSERPAAAARHGRRSRRAQRRARAATPARGTDVAHPPGGAHGRSPRRWAVTSPPRLDLDDHWMAGSVRRGRTARRAAASPILTRPAGPLTGAGPLATPSPGTPSPSRRPGAAPGPAQARDPVGRLAARAPAAADRGGRLANRELAVARRWSPRSAAARSTGHGLQEAANRVARLRGGLARTRPDRDGDGVPGDGVASGPAGPVSGPAGRVRIGLAAARRAVRVSGPRRTLRHPVIIEVEPRRTSPPAGSGGGSAHGRRPGAYAASVPRADR